jgi:hypothetical protein
MSDNVVTPIRQDVAVIAPKRKPRPTRATAKAERVERHIEKACGMIFQAQSIAAVTAAAALSEAPADRHCMRDAMELVVELLNKAAGRLDPVVIGRVLANASEFSQKTAPAVRS